MHFILVITILNMPHLLSELKLKFYGIIKCIGMQLFCNYLKL